MLNVIKEYLVSIGFGVDNASFKQTKGAINNMDKAVAGFAGNTVKQFAIASTAFASFFVAANVGIAKYIEGLAKADLENEKFARRMWMSKDNAIAYKNTLDALGASLQDLYLSPELLQRYNQLRQQAGMMAAPQEYDDQMKQIRDITFEFQRLKLEATYAMQWIGYYLFKYLEKPINTIKQALQNLNDKIVKDMPAWTKKVAQVLSWFVRLGSAAVWGIQKLKEAFDSLTPATKTAGVAVAGLFTLFKMGPIGWIIAGLTALLLLLDDYKTYQEGGQSLFSDSWKKLDELKKSLEDDGTLQSFRESLDSISKSLQSIFEWAGKIGDKLLDLMGFDDLNDFIAYVLKKTLQDLDDLLWSISKALESISLVLEGKFGEAFWVAEDSAKRITDAANPLNDFIEEDNIFMNIAEKITSWIFGEDSAAQAAQQSRDDFKNFNNWTEEMRESIHSWLKGLFTKHADGGIQTTPHLGWVAEEYPEAIIPLDPNRKQNALNLLSQTAGILGAPMTSTSSSTINYYNVTNSPKYTIYGSEPTATAKAIDRTVDYGQLIRNFRGAY